MRVQVIENVLKLNDEIAGLNRERLRRAGVLGIDLIGAPGCGKTALLEATLQRLGADRRVGIVVGDLTTQRDADRMARFCDQVVQINTGKGCHLEAQHVRQALSRIELSRLDILFIENVGNLICPVGFDLGQDVKIGMFSICGGDDKAAKHPYIVAEAGLLLLTKMDLLPYCPFDLEQFRKDIKRLNPIVELIETSITSGQGIDGWIKWVNQQRAAKQALMPAR
jgi:hydrogenase nickel incorporation protein HypB